MSYSVDKKFDRYKVTSDTEKVLIHGMMLNYIKQATSRRVLKMYYILLTSFSLMQLIQPSNFWKSNQTTFALSLLSFTTAPSQSKTKTSFDTT